MNWGIEDFGAAAALLIGAGIALALIFGSVVRRRRLQLVLSGGVVLIVLAIWAHLAVGVF